MDRDKQAVLRELVDKSGSAGRVGESLQSNKEDNWLIAVVLNSFAKHAAKADLTNLEAVVVDTYQHQGMSEAEIDELGVLFRDMPPADKAKLLPGKFAQFDPTSNYTGADLESDLSVIHKGRPRQDVPLTGHHEPDPDARYRIRALSFECLEQSTPPDEVRYTADKPYWIFTTFSRWSEPQTVRTRTFPGVNAGETREFPPPSVAPDVGAERIDRVPAVTRPPEALGIHNTGCLWGPNCEPERLPSLAEGGVVTIIALWENDDPRAPNAVLRSYTAHAELLQRMPTGDWLVSDFWKAYAALATAITTMIGTGDELIGHSWIRVALDDLHVRYLEPGQLGARDSTLVPGGFHQYRLHYGVERVS